MQTSVATVENNVEFPQKTKNGTAFWPSDPTSGNTSEEPQVTSSEEYVHPYVHSSIIHNGQDLEASKVFSVYE